MRRINLSELEANQNTFILHKECADKRKKTWQKQNKGLKIKVGDCVKLAVSDTKGTEHLWFQVKEENPFVGRCDNYPIVIKKVKYKDIVPFKFEDIEDYVKKSYHKVNSNELAKLKTKQLALNRIAEEKIRKIGDDCYLDFMLPPTAFNFNDDKNWRLLFEPENLTWRSKKTNKVIQPQNLSITKEKIIDELSFLFTDCVCWILSAYGEFPYREVARYLHFSERLIDETVSFWKKEQKEVKKHESNNTNSV